jgi:hypothetical protein
MNAYELADAIKYCGDGGYNQDAATMLRQQADRIAELEVYEKQIKQMEAAYDRHFEAALRADDVWKRATGRKP